MRSISTTTLFCMEVINLCDGARLGTTQALELDADCGNVTALIVPVECGFFSFGKCDAYRIPWCRIECIGEDTVLVKLSAADLSACLFKQGKK